MATFSIAALTARIGQGRSYDLITEPTFTVQPNIVKPSFSNFLVHQGQLGMVKRHYVKEDSPPFCYRTVVFFHNEASLQHQNGCKQESLIAPSISLKFLFCS